jgi:hypothetical protein
MTHLNSRRSQTSIPAAFSTAAQVATDILDELTRYPDHWTQGYIAQNASGLVCPASDPEAVSWCLFGHILKRNAAFAEHSIGAAFGYPLTSWSEWNDRRGRTVAEVIALLRRVIEAGQEADTTGMLTATPKIAQDPTYFEGFPDIAFPQWLQRLGFEDASWKNDDAARTTKRLPKGRLLCVWADYDNPDEREIPGSEKYLIDLLPNEDAYTTSELTISIGATNAEETAQVMVYNFLNRYMRFDAALADMDRQFESRQLSATNEEQVSSIERAMAGEVFALNVADGMLDDWEDRFGADVAKLRSLLAARQT